MQSTFIRPRYTVQQALGPSSRDREQSNVTRSVGMLMLTDILTCILAVVMCLFSFFSWKYYLRASCSSADITRDCVVSAVTFHIRIQYVVIYIVYLFEYVVEAAIDRYFSAPAWAFDRFMALLDPNRWTLERRVRHFIDFFDNAIIFPLRIFALVQGAIFWFIPMLVIVIMTLIAAYVARRRDFMSSQTLDDYFVSVFKDAFKTWCLLISMLAVIDGLYLFRMTFSVLWNALFGLFHSILYVGNILLYLFRMTFSVLWNALFGLFHSILYVGKILYSYVLYLLIACVSYGVGNGIRNLA